MTEHGPPWMKHKARLGSGCKEEKKKKGVVFSFWLSALFSLVVFVGIF